MKAETRDAGRREGVLSWRDARDRLAHPAFDAIRASLDPLSADEWPGLDELNRCLRGARNFREFELKFAGPQSLPPALPSHASASAEPSGKSPGTHAHYELRIANTGEIATRTNWHDLFNALVWTAFPRAKSAISEMHARIIEAEGDAELKSRGVARDVLTLFDESGAIVVSESRELLEMLRAFEWKKLFWERRAEWERHARVYLSGHALMEKMLAPHIGVTAKCVLLEVPEGWLSSGDAGTRQAAIDRRAAEHFMNAAHLASTRALQPLPLLGIPGWDARSDDAAFYDDTGYFRPGYSRLPRVQ